MVGRACQVYPSGLPFNFLWTSSFCSRTDSFSGLGFYQLHFDWFENLSLTSLTFQGFLECQVDSVAYAVEIYKKWTEQCGCEASIFVVEIYWPIVFSFSIEIVYWSVLFQNSMLAIGLFSVLHPCLILFL